MIIVVGTNNLTKSNQSTQETVNEIINIVETCQNAGVNDVFVSGLTCRPQFQAKINDINEQLARKATQYNYEFIDNYCVLRNHLKRDDVHVNEEGMSILKNNFLTHLNINNSSCKY